MATAKPWKLWRSDDNMTYHEYSDEDVEDVAHGWEVLVRTPELLIVRDPSRTPKLYVLLIMWKENK